MVAALAFLLFVLIPSATWGQPEQEYTDNFKLTASNHTRASSSRLGQRLHHVVSPVHAAAPWTR